MFVAEAADLNMLQAHSSSLNIPEVLGMGVSGPYAFLMLEHLTESQPSTHSWESLGIGLAELHKTSQPSFGLSSNNYIGSLTQPNHETASWPEFYARHRIQPMIDRAQGQFASQDLKTWDLLRARLPQLLPCTIPSLIHGDLWSGNVMNTKKGPAIYDPAIAFADREMDLAMSKLFGGFPISFYSAYNNTWNIEPGFNDRLPLYQLYYLLVHVVLFGGHYVNSVRQVFARYN